MILLLSPVRQHRRFLVDWISEAGMAFKLDRTTIHVAVRLVGHPSSPSRLPR
jgi:hypothetical protein